jgi:hypothetical protein
MTIMLRHDRATLAKIAADEQRRQVDERRAQLRAATDPAERARIETRIKAASLAWGHIALWLEDPVQLPATIDQPAIHAFARNAARAVRAKWATEADQSSNHPNAAHWSGLLDIERLIALRWPGIAQPARPERVAA